MTDISPAPDAQREARTEEQHHAGISLLGLAIVLAKRKKLIIALPVIVAAIAAIMSLQMTPIYTGTTRILPPQQQSATASMFGQLGALAGAGATALGIKNPADLYVGMLKSRTISDHLVQRFALMDVYKTKYRSDARMGLENRSTVTIGKDGIITIEVDDTDAARAADIANGYVEELTKLTDVLAVTEAGQRRLFFERQMLSAKENLTKAEIAAQRAMNEGGIATVDEQGKSLIQTTATLRAQIAAKEVQISAMRNFATEKNPEFVKAVQELSALREQIAKIEGHGAGPANKRNFPVGEGGLRNVTLLRDVKYYEALFELLSKQYEVAKIDEAKEGAVIQVIDKAIPPERRSRPKRTFVVLLSTLAATIIAVLVAFLAEAIENASKDPDTRGRLIRLRRYLSWR